MAPVVPVEPAYAPGGTDGFNGREFDAVAMGCENECPLVFAKKRVEWQITDPKELPPDQFNDVRDLIERKAKELLVAL